MINERPCIVDGRPCDWGDMPDGLYVSQNIAVTGRRGVSVDRYAEALDYASRELLGFGIRQSARSIERDIETLFADNGYPADGLSRAIVRQYLSGEFVIRAGEILPYRERALRVVFPRAAVVDYDIPFSEVRSSLSEAALEAAYGHLPRGVQTVLRRSSRGGIVSADGAPLFAVAGKRVTTPEPEVPSAEFEMAAEAVLAAGLDLVTGEVDSEMLLEADELFFADYRGITAVSSFEERHYMHLMAARVGHRFLKNI